MQKEFKREIGSLDEIFAFIDDFRLAVVRGETVVDVSDVTEPIPHITAQDLITGLITRFDEFRPKLEAAAQSRGGGPIGSVRFRPPHPMPGRMVCMAGNYMESGTIPKAYDADAFLKSPSSVIGDGDTVVSIEKLFVFLSLLTTWSCAIETSCYNRWCHG